jgi:GDPmannose 4,6-dehydratase
MMWMILQADEAEDWVIANRKTTTVRDFVKMALQNRNQSCLKEKE